MDAQASTLAHTYVPRYECTLSSMDLRIGVGSDLAAAAHVCPVTIEEPSASARSQVTSDAAHSVRKPAGTKRSPITPKGNEACAPSFSASLKLKRRRWGKAQHVLHFHDGLW